jgi:Trypsin-co-occurring domain 2
MRSRLAVFVSLAVLSLAVLPPTPVCAQATPVRPLVSAKNSVPLESLLVQVKDALAVAERLAQEKNLPPLESVTLTLQTVAVTTQGGTVKLFIFKWGTTITTTSTKTVVLTLTPPPPSTEKSLAPVTDNLVNAMLAASEAVQAARGSLPGFEPKQVVCEYSFGVRQEGAGGISFEILPVSVSGDASASRQAVQTVSLSFKKK